MDLKFFRLSLLILSCLLYSCNSHSHSHSHDDHHHHDDDQVHENPSFKYSREANIKAQVPTSESKHHQKHSQIASNQDIWLFAMGSTLLISAAPVIFLFIVPLDNSEQKQPLLKVLLAFASGGLLGDAFLHLIPHATMKDHDHHHHHEELHEGEEHVHDMSVGLGVLSGILAFLIIEKCVRIMKGSHGHSHGSSKKENAQSKKNKTDKKSKSDSNNKTGEGDKQEVAIIKPEIKVAGYLNLAADFSHNFTDGLAIGASYLAGNGVGMITTVTILLHEVPHELGDFAILLQSGVSRKNAMLLQLTTAIGALAGTALSLCAQDGYGLLATNWILPFTAGGFIYIALVSVIPELLEEEKPSILWTFLQLAAMLLGVYMMVLIAKFE